MAIISAAELAAHMGIADGEDGTALQRAVDAANEFVVDYCGRDFTKTAVGAPTVRLFSPLNGYVLTVDDFWEASALVVKTDTQGVGIYDATWPATDYVVEPRNGRVAGRTVPYNTIRAVGTSLFPVRAWPTDESVQITAAWGWASIPAGVKSGALLYAARLFRRKDSPEGVLGGFQDFSAVRVSRFIDPDVEQTLGPYRIHQLVH